MYPEAERGDERRELDVEISESERLRLRTIVAVGYLYIDGVIESSWDSIAVDELMMKRRWMDGCGLKTEL